MLFTPNYAVYSWDGSAALGTLAGNVGPPLRWSTFPRSSLGHRVPPGSLWCSAQLTLFGTSRPKGSSGKLHGERRGAGPGFKFATAGPTRVKMARAAPGPPHTSWSPWWPWVRTRGPHRVTAFQCPLKVEGATVHSAHGLVAGKRQALEMARGSHSQQEAPHPHHSPGGWESPFPRAGRAGILGTALAWAWGWKGSAGQLWSELQSP